MNWIGALAVVVPDAVVGVVTNDMMGYQVFVLLPGKLRNINRPHCKQQQPLTFYRPLN